tara:strand:+ start:3070 stop:4380 length:1311 start_codon:yes stop_codon:yes gene_type:complete
LSLYPKTPHGEIALGAACEVAEPNKIPAGNLDEPANLLDLEHCGIGGELLEHATTEEIGSTRIRMTGYDLATTRLRPYLGKTVAIPEGETIGSPEWICLTADPSVLRPRFLHAVLLGRAYRDLAKDLSAGQQHPRISVDTLRRMRIPLLPLEQQDMLVSRIDLLRAELIGSLGPKDLRAAIDAAFCDRFGLDPKQVEIGPSPRVSATSFLDVAASRDVRFSWRYHAPESRRARADLWDLSSGPLAGFLQGGSQLGKSVTPEIDYATGTGFHYLTMAGLARWEVDPEPCPELTEVYFEENEDRHVTPGDVLMARSGEGTIGKVGLVEEGVTGCFADFVIRIRADPDRLSPTFLRYMLMSAHYQTLISAEKKGLGNNTNIFPVQVDAFPMLNVDLNVQNEIVHDIGEVEKQVKAARRRAREIEDEIEVALETAISLAS